MRRRIVSYFILMIATASCTENSLSPCPSKTISLSNSNSDYCWIDRNGDFISYVVLKKLNNGAYPIFISARCSYISDEFDDEMLSIQFSSRSFIISNPSILNEISQSRDIIRNDISEEPFVDGDNDVYLISANASLADRKLEIHNINAVEKLGSLERVINKRRKCYSVK